MDVLNEPFKEKGHGSSSVLGNSFLFSYEKLLKKSSKFILSSDKLKFFWKLKQKIIIANGLDLYEYEIVQFKSM